MERYAIDLFDGHCDAVFLRYLSGGGLRRNDGHVDLERMGKYRRCAQFFALFGEPEPTPVRISAGNPPGALSGGDALFEREMAANADLAAFCRTGAEAERPSVGAAGGLPLGGGGGAAGLLPGAAGGGPRHGGSGR
ncbi:MAG: hypothetical protein ACLRIS_03430 [Flavonifractor plautii]